MREKLDEDHPGLRGPAGAAWATRPCSPIRRNTTAWPRSTRSQGPLAKKAREYVQASDDLAAAKEMMADPDMKRVRAGGDSRHRGEAARARGGHQVHAHPGRPGRRQGHHRGDPRGVPAATRRPSSRATSTRCTSASPSAQGWKTETHGRVGLRGRRLQGDPSSRSRATTSYSRHEVRERRAPRAARARRPRARAASTPPRPRWPCCPRPTRWRSTSTRTTCASTCTAPAARAASASTRTDSAVRITHLPTRPGGAVAGPEVAAAEPRSRPCSVLRARLYEKMLARAAGRRSAPSASAQIGHGRPLGEDPHLQRPAGPRDRPPHRLQRHLQRRASGRRPGRRDHRPAGRRPRAEAGSRGLMFRRPAGRRNLPTLRRPVARRLRASAGSRTEVRFVRAIPRIRRTTGLLADLLRQPATPSNLRGFDHG